MATYYWVGGAGTWDNATNTKWSLTSGGAGGAGIPTSADDVIFNSASNATGYTVTVSTGAVCKSMTVNGPATGTVTFSGSATWTFYGSITLGATGVSINCSCPVTLAATTTGNTITTNGVGFTSGNWTFSGSGDYTLGSALSMSGSISVTASTLSTNNYTLSTWTFSVSGGTINLGSSSVSAPAGFGASGGTLNLNSSTIIIAAFYAGFSVGGTATLNAGTSTINMSGNYNGAIDINGRTLYNVIFNTGMSQSNFASSATMNNLTINMASGGGTLTLYANITVTGTFSTINATNAAVRVFLRSDTTTARTITAAALSITDIDFRYITGAGAAAPFTGSRLSDYGNNTNITFSAPKTVYWNLAGSQSWTAVAWATTSGGAPNGLNFPLLQDTAVIDNAGAAGTITIPNTVRVGTIDGTARTSAYTLNGSNPTYIYGSIRLGSFATSSFGEVYFYPRSSTIQVQIPGSASIYLFSGTGTETVSLQGALTATGYSGLGESSIRTSSIGLVTNGYSITAPAVRITSGTQTVDFGSSTITCTGNNVASGNPEPFNVISANLIATSSTIIFSSTTNGSARTFAGGGKSYGTFRINGGAATTQIVVIGGSNTFNSLTSDKTVAWTLQFAAGSNNSFGAGAWAITGTLGNVLTLTSTSTTAATLTYTGTTYVSFDYASVSYISGRAANFKWFAGANSTDAGNNSAVYFFAPPYDPTPGNFLAFFVR